ncbi:MAG TPA: polynucleotide 5'-hydroxyl-kinase, partial [Chthonomonadales bacterium]|nr:polynucleotide 5'-hydroxyl-kinase [Chthonomonadales bacterium]
MLARGSSGAQDQVDPAGRPPIEQAGDSTAAGMETAERTEPYLEWESSLAGLASAQGCVLVLGGTDTGKTTFSRLLVDRILGSGGSAAILDADVGQSEIGPPGTLGLELHSTGARAHAQNLAFLGATSPAGRLLHHAAAVRRLADSATVDRLVVDTPGYITGSEARALIQAEFELLSPAHVVALQRGKELEAVLKPISMRKSCQVHRLPIPRVVQVRPAALRAKRRE